MGKQVVVAGSTHPCPPEKLVEYAHKLKEAGVKILHCDIMDGEFVGDKTFDYNKIKYLSEKVPLFLDVHLMVSEENLNLQKYIDAGAGLITVHYETFKNKQDIFKAFNTIRAGGVKVGLSINPDTSVEELAPFIDVVDVVLIMLVEPGRSGQTMNCNVIYKVSQINDYRLENNLNFKIQVDGGINGFNSFSVINAGTDIVVSGSYLYKSQDLSISVGQLLRV